MTARLFRLLPAIAMTTGVLLMGLAAFGAGDYAFSPPVGWTKLASGTNVKWADQTGKEYVVLHPTSFNGDLSSFVSAMLKKEKTQYPTEHVWTNKNYFMCGQHTGRYVIWTASGGGHTTIWEQMLALWGQDGYAVSYTRPESHKPNAAARASLLSICGVGEAAQPVGGVPVNAQNNAPAAGSGQSGGATIDQPTPGPTGTISHPYVPIIPGGG